MAEQEQGTDYYRHLIDEGVSERAIEQMVGEGWTVFAIYQAELEGGSIQPIDVPNPTPDAVNADKVLAEALRAIADLPTGRTEDVMEGHEDAYRAVERLQATPAPDKAVMPEAAVTEALGANEWLEWTRFEGGFPGEAEIKKQHAIIKRVLTSLATPTPVEEPEKGAAGLETIEKLVTAWHGGWSYDFGPRNVLNEVIEVAFDSGLGYTHVKICERKITRSMATYDRPLPVDQYEYGYFDEYGRDVSDGRRPYAWRKIALPPHPRPFPDSQPRDVETYIHNHCPDNVRDHVAALTAIAALAATNAGQVEAWQPIESAPYAMHVLAARFDDEAGEWIVHVAMSPPSKPFTHWRVLPAMPDGAGPVAALKANGDAS